MKFIDEAKILVKAGDGGDGCVSFRREKFVPRGGPNGGNGGRGGDIIFYADPNKASLLDYRYQRHLKAKRGGHGRGKDQHGASGESIRLPVPLGTEVWEASSQALLGDLDQNGRELVVARGGRGGRGNTHFKSSTRQAPRHAETGEPGEERTIRLELKLLADIGLVGLPNAGKSSLLRAVSAAHPKVADYPFTTKRPVLGVVGLSDERSFTVADLPGLIEGAHQGQGMGIQFLRHVERTRLLLHLVDLSTVKTEQVLAGFETIERELGEYDARLFNRPRLVVLSKIDLPAVQQNLKQAMQLFSDRHMKTLAVSSLTREGIDELLNRCWDILSQSEISDGK